MWEGGCDLSVQLAGADPLAATTSSILRFFVAGCVEVAGVECGCDCEAACLRERT